MNFRDALSETLGQLDAQPAAPGGTTTGAAQPGAAPAKPGEIGKDYTEQISPQEIDQALKELEQTYREKRKHLEGLKQVSHAGL